MSRYENLEIVNQHDEYPQYDGWFLNGLKWIMNLPYKKIGKAAVVVGSPFALAACASAPTQIVEPAESDIQIEPVESDIQTEPVEDSLETKFAEYQNDFSIFKEKLNIPEIYFKYEPVLYELSRIIDNSKATGSIISFNNETFTYNDGDEDVVYYIEDMSVCYNSALNELQFTMDCGGGLYELRGYYIVPSLYDESNLNISNFSSSSITWAYDTDGNCIGFKKEASKSGIQFDLPQNRESCLYSITEYFDNSYSQSISLYDPEDKEEAYCFYTDTTDPAKMSFYADCIDGKNTGYKEIEDPDYYLVQELRNVYQCFRIDVFKEFCIRNISPVDDDTIGNYSY